MTETEFRESARKLFSGPCTPTAQAAFLMILAVAERTIGHRAFKIADEELWALTPRGENVIPFPTKH